MSAPPNLLAADLRLVSMTFHDGLGDDLLTAGLGWDGLRSNIPPGVSSSPTVAELRRLAIYNNYRALVDMSEAGGYGRLFGPNVSLAGEVREAPGAGKIAGIEFLACCLDDTGHPAATLMVQIPDSFEPRRPTILVVPSPGSRGVYGGIAVGEWGLQRGFAVAYTDKGTGNGCHELGRDSVVLLDGLIASAEAAGPASHFTSDLTPSEREAFDLAHPFRYAFKHAHSRRNPEKDWGRFVLRAVEFALYAINERFAPEVPGLTLRTRHFDASNTRVIACSVSNGGGAVLAAAEQDAEGLIHGVVASEPQVSLRVPDGLTITRGGRVVASVVRPLYDYLSYANLIQPIAAHAASDAGSPLIGLVDATAARRRAQQLAQAGILSGATFEEQANDALKQLHDAGWEPESDRLHASHYACEATPAVTVTFANAYARARVSDLLCGFSFATTSDDGPDGMPAARRISPLTTLFGSGNGIPPTPALEGIRLVYDDPTGGPVDHRGGEGDFSLRGALRLRALWTDPGEHADRLRQSVDEVRLTGHLRGKPTLVVHGRSDALLPVNHTSRPYYGINQFAEGTESRLSYIEVENAQHFDTFLSLIPGYAGLWIPLHHYLQQALGMMWDHLENGTPLPPSQVVRTTPRGQGASPLSEAAHLNPIAPEPATGDVIRFDASARTVQVPD